MKAGVVCGWVARAFLALAISSGADQAMAEFTVVGSGFDGEIPHLSITFHVPPAMVTVEDEEGRLNGVDASKPLNQVGEGVGLGQIPGSYVDQNNIGSDDPADHGAQNPQTDWSMLLSTKSPHAYRMRVTGIRDGIEKIILAGSEPAEGMVIPIREIHLLVSPGSDRVLNIRYDPNRRLLSTERAAVPGDLDGSVQLACSLKLIAPGGVCRSLLAKASAMKSAWARGRMKAARGSLIAFLNELQAQGGKHIQEPALTILREEAEALLASGPASGKGPKTKSKASHRPGK